MFPLAATILQSSVSFATGAQWPPKWSLFALETLLSQQFTEMLVQRQIGSAVDHLHNMWDRWLFVGWIVVFAGLAGAADW